MNKTRLLPREQRILAIETSSPRLSLAVGTTSNHLKSYQGPLRWRHAESLFAGMEGLLKRQHWPVQSLTGVAVSTGPGSFTGIRIGLAAARALGQALKIPVVGVSSLKSLAYSFLEPGRYVCPAIDALRGDVFTALFALDTRGTVKTLWKESRWPLTVWLHKLKTLRQKPLWLAGDGVGPYHKEIKALAGPRWKIVPEAQAYPHARALIRLAGRNLASSPASSYKQVVPMYLRSAAAVERRKAR